MFKPCIVKTFPTNSLSYSDLNYELANIKNIHYGLIHNSFCKTLISGKSNKIPRKYTLIKNGDLIIADASENRIGVEKSVEMIEIQNNKIICGLHTIRVRNKTEFKLKKIIDKPETLIKGIRVTLFKNIYSYDSQASIKKLGVFLHPYTEYNTSNDLEPVSIGKYGIRLRKDIYSKKLSDDYSKNKVIYKNTLVIGMGSTQIDLNILYTDSRYCVSPAYTTYNIKNIDAFFLNEYMLFLNKLLSNKYMIISARQGKSVNKSDLLNHKIVIPNKITQDKINAVLKAYYKKLNNEKSILLFLKKQKDYFLKNMFI